MQHAATLDIIGRAIRVKVCSKCDQRPEGSEEWEPTWKRPCEGGCAIFQNLPRLTQIVASIRDSHLDAYEAAVRNSICSRCKITPTAGEYCVAYFNRSCPMSRYLSDVVAVLSRVPQVMACDSEEAAAAVAGVRR
jgi:hypothetical protein